MSLLTLILWSKAAFSNAPTYYNFKEISELTSGRLTGRDLIDFVDNVSHKGFKPLGYRRGSRRALFEYIDLDSDEKGYFVKDVYCNYKIRLNVGPNKIPPNNIMNIEHTWPQSKGAKYEPFKGDIHHLYPTDARANSTRGNYPFGEVRGKSISFNCTASKIGHMINPITKKTTRQRAYQPPQGHRGNVARALFYAAGFYGYNISDIQEYYLKKWHTDDPVDTKEFERNNQIEEIQGNRNPYIDFPEIVERINNF